MERMPAVSRTEKESDRAALSSKEYPRLRSEFFHDAIAAKIVDTYERDMETLGFSGDEISEFREHILSMSPEGRERLYAFPWELKQRALPAFLKKIREGRESIATMAEKIADASTKQHRRIAYHASLANINPKKERGPQGGTIDSWVIHGTEKDHRDGDLPMAYYSFDYEHLYRAKNPKYIYIVSIQEDERFGHRKDGNNEWGRAPSLTVIDKIDLVKLDTELDAATKEELKKAA